MTISIKPTASGSTIEQDGSTILTVDGSGNITPTNNLTATSLSTSSGSAPSYSARAWVNFNGTGTVAIRDSGNVSSITDDAVGRYTVNFATNMPDINYSVSGIAQDTLAGASSNSPSVTINDATSSTTTSTLYIAVISGNGSTFMDSPTITVQIIR